MLEFYLESVAFYKSVLGKFSYLQFKVFTYLNVIYIHSFIIYSISPSYIWSLGVKFPYFFYLFSYVFVISKYYCVLLLVHENINILC